MGYGVPVHINCQGGSIQNAVIYEPTMLLGWPYYDMTWGGSAAPGSASKGSNTFYACTLDPVLAEDVGP